LVTALELLLASEKTLFGNAYFFDSRPAGVMVRMSIKIKAIGMNDKGEWKGRRRWEEGRDL
jgi:hypothetical protein